MARLIYDLKEGGEGVFEAFRVGERWPLLEVGGEEMVLLGLGKLEPEVRDDVENLLVGALMKDGRKVVKHGRALLFTRKIEQAAEMEVGNVKEKADLL